MTERAHCTRCDSNVGVFPLHGDKGGPLMCFMCAGAWHAKHEKRRKAGRILIKAMKAYFAAGGSHTDLHRIKLAAWDIPIPGFDGDTLGADVGDITSELLADTIQLTHPDRHPIERAELAERVTKELNALKPFVFPAPKPKPLAAGQERDASSKDRAKTLDEALRKALASSYPCTACANEIPLYYCSACRAEWEKRNREQLKRQSAKQREWYAQRKQRSAVPPTICTGCGTAFKAPRRNARHCSPACRQRAHRKRVTVLKTSAVEVRQIRDIAEARP